MANLSAQQINLSYPGLLTLETATAGIQSTPQELQDGLGGNTGFQIGTNRLEGGNLFNIYRPSVAKYFGNGLASTSSTPAAGTQNNLLSCYFYDNGLNAYSAFTINCTTLEAGTSVDVAFYNTQYLENYGYVPYQKLSTEINISTTSTGFKVGTFASPLTFSGTGPGFYYCVYRYNTAGTPVVRLASSSVNVATYLSSYLNSNNGFVFNTAGTVAQTAFQINGTSAFAVGSVYNTASFPSTWTSTQLNTITSVASPQLGFLLHTIR